MSFDAATSNFSLNASDPAYQHLAAGQVQTVTVKYGVTDGMATTAATATFTVVGTNDAPVVSGAAHLTVHEDGIAQTFSTGMLLANASDVDDNTVLQVADLPAQFPSGVSQVDIAGGFI